MRCTTLDEAEHLPPLFYLVQELGILDHCRNGITLQVFLQFSESMKCRNQNLDFRNDVFLEMIYGSFLVLRLAECASQTPGVWLSLATTPGQIKQQRNFHRKISHFEAQNPQL